MSTLFDHGYTPIKGVARAVALAASGTVVIPAGALVRRIFFRNKTANAVTGGIKVGTTDGGVDVLAAGAVAASAVVGYTPLIGAYSATARTLYVQAVTGWNSAVVDVAVEYDDLI